MIDSEEGITDQDKKIAEISNDAGKAIILIVNKWDLIENKQSNTIKNLPER